MVEDKNGSKIDQYVQFCFILETTQLNLILKKNKLASLHTNRIQSISNNDMAV